MNLWLCLMETLNAATKLKPGMDNILRHDPACYEQFFINQLVFLLVSDGLNASQISESQHIRNRN